MLLVARRDRTEVLELVEEVLDEVPIAVKEGTEGGRVHPLWHWSDVCPGTLGVHLAYRAILLRSTA